MIVYALVSSRAPSKAVELYLSRADAEDALRAVELDDASLAALLSVVPLDFDTRQPVASLN